MADYEVIREIENACSNNQMRDVFFNEISCESPEAYVRALFPDSKTQFEIQRQDEDQVVIYVTADGLSQKYIFTKV